LEITKDLSEDQTVPERCSEENIAKNDDPLDRHLQRICNFVRDLKGDYSLKAIARVWVEAFKKEDKRLLECGCQRGATVKGLTVDPDWLFAKGDGYSPRLDLGDSVLVGSKVIRMKRRDIWARVKARLLAEATFIWNPLTKREKEEQLNALDGDLEVDIDDLRKRMQNIHNIDNGADEWARTHASDVLWIESEECKENKQQCMARVANFLKVDRSFFDDKDVFGSSLDFDGSLDYIGNKEQVQQVLDEFKADEIHKTIGERRRLRV